MMTITREMEKTMNSGIYRGPLLLGLALILVAGCEPSYGDPPGIGTPEKDVGIAQDMGVVEQNDATGMTYKWNCTEAEDRRVCTKEDQDLGLPVGGNNWRCNRYSVKDVLTWICYGEAAAAPSGDGWICELAVWETAVWKCIRPEGPGPPMRSMVSRCWTAWSWTAGGGQTRSAPVTTSTTTLTVVSVPIAWFPRGATAELCGKSGGGLCSYCNPQNPECTEADAQCVVTDHSGHRLALACF